MLWINLFIIWFDFARELRYEIECGKKYWSVWTNFVASCPFIMDFLKVKKLLQLVCKQPEKKHVQLVQRLKTWLWLRFHFLGTSVSLQFNELTAFKFSLGCVSLILDGSENAWKNSRTCTFSGLYFDLCIHIYSIWLRFDAQVLAFKQDIVQRCRYFCDKKYIYK